MAVAVSRLVAATAGDMRAIGAALAPSLEAGDLVVVTGSLGAGKTTFVQGLGAGLGVHERILSPTFVLARVHHSGRLPLVHVDAYRLADAADPLAELDALDLDTDLADAVVAVEWGEGLVERLAADRLHVTIIADPGAGPGTEARRLELRPAGARWAGRPLPNA
jgi:tRNA threonylcarbamoyladenosine biosynthesis protein TsaE